MAGLPAIILTCPGFLFCCLTLWWQNRKRRGVLGVVRPALHTGRQGVVAAEQGSGRVRVKVAVASSLYRVPRSTIYRWLSDQRLTADQHGRVALIEVEQLAEMRIRQPVDRLRLPATQ